MITVHFNHAIRHLDILKLLCMSDGRTGRRKQVKRAKKWDNFVIETAIEEDWRQNVRMIRRSLYKLANELRLNPDTCRIRVEGQIRVQYGYVWTWKFFNQQRKICGFKTRRGP